MPHIIPQSDVRITYAADFLKGRRKVSVSTLPPSVLLRECAELRRQLGIVLDVITERSVSAAEHETLLTALTDARAYRENRADSACAECDSEPDGICYVHLAELDLASAYTVLARKIAGRS